MPIPMEILMLMLMLVLMLMPGGTLTDIQHVSNQRSAKENTYIKLEHWCASR